MKVRPSVKPMCEKCKIIRRKGLQKNNRLFKNLLSGEIIFDYNTTIFNNCQSVFRKLIDIFFIKV